jgi:DNA-binding FrmR family transcriptional regulator
MGTELHLQLSEPDRDGLLARLRRIEGQVKGLQRMLREERDCEEITQQLAAARAALDNVAVNLLTAGLEHCLESPSAAEPGRLKAVVRKLQHSLLILR